jgi:tyrosinase
MPRTRRDVWKIDQQPWSDTLLWYARGVAVLKNRDITDRNSWTFFGAMHGIDQALWTAFGYITPATQLPPQADQDEFWKQCQHQTWYFLPWHRAYLAAFESAIRGAIAPLNGPTDWALPYWDYSDSTDPNALTFPPAFSAPQLPDGTPNPLAEARRYGDGTGQIVIQASDVALTALQEPQFEGSTQGGSTGFGGVRTPFRHGGPNSANGVLERQPHNIIHGLVGGVLPNSDPNDERSYGLMSLPDTAALDPIFWLHHANIDRLWEVWLRRSAQNANPTDNAWLTGPSDRAFALPLPVGSTWNATAADVLNTQSPRLDYFYENTSDPFGGADLLAQRLARLGAPVSPAPRLRVETTMTQSRTELVGASQDTIRLTATPVETRVRVDPAPAQRTFRTLEAVRSAPESTVVPDRVFLNLENVRGRNDAAVFYVYVSHPTATVPETLAGVVSLFGVKKASQPDGAQGGNGLNESLDITAWVDQLHAAGVQDLDGLKIRIVPRTTIRPEDEISIGRVSLFRQSS